MGISKNCIETAKKLPKIEKYIEFLFGFVIIRLVFEKIFTTEYIFCGTFLPVLFYTREPDNQPKITLFQ